MFKDVVAIMLICQFFIHLGLGDTINKILHFDFILFRCIKCLTFWSVLIYMCLYTRNVVEVLLVSFSASFFALWLDILFDKVIEVYNKWAE